MFPKLRLSSSHSRRFLTIGVLVSIKCACEVNLGKERKEVLEFEFGAMLLHVCLRHT